jgi:uncharacterized RDD family membrane protein YckC
MPWQTMRDGEIQGPFSDPEFERMLKGLEPTTKIHHDSWSAWRKLQDLRPDELPQPPPPPPLDESKALPAGFLRRAGALLIDYFLIGWLLGLVGLNHAFLSSSYAGQGSWFSYASWSSATTGSFLADHLGWQFAATLVYETLMTWRLGWTLGKFVFGLVVRHEGRNPNWGRAAARVLAKKANVLIFMIGYLMALWDKDNKALHDHLCKTRVFLR